VATLVIRRRCEGERRRRRRGRGARKRIIASSWGGAALRGSSRRLEKVRRTRSGRRKSAQKKSFSWEPKKKTGIGERERGTREETERVHRQKGIVEKKNACTATEYCPWKKKNSGRKAADKRGNPRHGHHPVVPGRGSSVRRQKSLGKKNTRAAIAKTTGTHREKNSTVETARKGFTREKGEVAQKTGQLRNLRYTQSGRQLWRVWDGKGRASAGRKKRTQKSLEPWGVKGGYHVVGRKKDLPGGKW